MGNQGICKLQKSQNCGCTGEGTMIGVFMFRNGLSLDGIGSSVDGLLDEEPILRELVC